MDVTAAKAQFREIISKLNAFYHAVGVIQLDALTAAPSDTSEGRGKSLGILSRYMYDLSAGKQTEEIVAYLLSHKDELSETELRELTEFNRENEYLRSIPADEYVAYTVLLNKADAVWHKAKEENDFEAFQPILEEIFETNKRFSLYYKPNEDPL